MAATVAVDELKQQEIQLKYKEQDVRTAEAQLDSNQIALDQAKQELGYTTVNAPIDGTVSALDVQLGTIVASAASGGFSGGTTILTLSDLSRIFVMATVDESDIGGVARRPGRPAIVVDSLPGPDVRGEGRPHRRRPASAPRNVVTFEVKVEVTGQGQVGCSSRSDDRHGHGRRGPAGRASCSVPTSAVAHEAGQGVR